MKLQPDLAQAHNDLGIALCRQGRLEEGIRQFEQALTWRPDLPEAHSNLGVALARQGRRDEAVRQLTEALKLRPNYPEAEQQLRRLTGAPPP